jgi:two-component system sensor histidine kinase UhpB
MLDAEHQPRRTPLSPVIAARKRLAKATGDAFDRLPLFWGVLAINAAVLVVATLLLALTPLTVSYPIAVEQAVVLAVMLAFMVIANTFLLYGGMRPLLETLQRLDHADLAPAHLPEVGGVETRAIAKALNTALDRLEAERRASARRVLAALEGERRRVGHELHDEIGQRLTGILLELSPLIAAAPEHLRPRLSAVQEDARATLHEVGQLAWQLRPSVLDDLGLVASLDALIDGIEEHTDVAIRRSLPRAAPALSPEVELAVFRIGQEAVTNAIRHAGASQIDVRLDVSEGLRLAISDDGQGLPTPERTGPGIQGMQERALLADGVLTIFSPGGLGGVTVELTLPRTETEG